MKDSSHISTTTRLKHIFIFEYNFSLNFYSIRRNNFCSYSVLALTDSVLLSHSRAQHSVTCILVIVFVHRNITTE